MDRRSFLKFIPYIAALALPVKAIATPPSKMPNLPTDDGMRKRSHFYLDTDTNFIYKWHKASQEWIKV